MKMRELRQAAEYADTFREQITIEARAAGIRVEAYQDGMSVQKLRSWVELETTRQLNPLTYLIDQTVKELTAAPRSLEG